MCVQSFVHIFIKKNKNLNLKVQESEKQPQEPFKQSPCFIDTDWSVTWQQQSAEQMEGTGGT